MGFLKHTGDTTDFNAARYHKILCADYPDFLDEYLRLPILQRLDGVTLLCGTDWTPLFKNRFYYSRLQHSIGTALIVWNFTHDLRQTLAGLLHDVSTPAFSHVIDFRNGDSLMQESTEQNNQKMINEDLELSELLFSHGIYKYEIDDYHRYPIADNNIPGLSADRLEYMFPSGCSLDAVWTMDEIERLYSQVAVLENDDGLPELGFVDKEAALEYMRKFIEVSMVLQHNEDKVAMQLMADVVSRAVECKLIEEGHLFTISEKALVEKFDALVRDGTDEHFARLYHTFRNMKVVQHTQEPLADSYCVSVSVKKRYVNPLVKVGGGSGSSHAKAKRLSALSSEAESCINEFLSFSDTQFGCVPWC